MPESAWIAFAAIVLVVFVGFVVVQTAMYEARIRRLKVVNQVLLDIHDHNKERDRIASMKIAEPVPHKLTPEEWERAMAAAFKSAREKGVVVLPNGCALETVNVPTPDPGQSETPARSGVNPPSPSSLIPSSSP